MTDGPPPYRSGFVEATSIGFKGLRDRLAEMLERGNRLRRRYSFTLLWMPAIAAFFVGIIAISAFKRGGLATTNGEPHRTIGEADTDPRPPAVTFATTEHFVLQGARAATIAESSGRATMFLASVSGGLVALGLVATASRVGTAFYAFGLVLDSRPSPSSGW